MRIALVSDIHAAVKMPHAVVKPCGTSSDRLEESVGALFKALTGLATGPNPIDTVFILGDLFDSRSPDMPTLTYVASALKALAKHADVYILPGNHDAHDKGGRLYTLSLFDALRIPRVHIALKPMNRILGDVDWHLIPWVPEHLVRYTLDELDARRGSAPRHKRTVALMHQTVEGAVEGGRRLASPLRATHLAHYNAVYSGHIHQPQGFANINYLGSPYAIRFSDADNLARGIHVKDTDDMRHTTLIPLHAPRMVRCTFESMAQIDEFTAGPKVVPLLQHNAAYYSFKLKGPRSFVDEAERTLFNLREELASRAALNEIKLWRTSKLVTDDGAGSRLRTAATDDGAVLTPSALTTAFIDSYTGSLPDGVELSDLHKYASALLVEAHGE